MASAAGPLSALLAFEHLTGLTVGIYDHTRTFWNWLPPERTAHTQIICRLVRHSRQDICADFEAHQVARALAAGLPDGASKICHVGLVEWTAPIHLDGIAIARLFAGVRRAGPDLVPEVVDRVRSATGPWESRRRTIPLVSAADSTALLELLRQLAARLALWHQDGRQQPAALGAGAPLATRRQWIDRWVARHGLGRVSLAWLAKDLEVSPSRAGHVVREHFGCTFPQLLARYRCAVAAEHLRATDLPLREVALRSGFPSLAHFHAVFQQRFAESPGSYRQQQGGGH